MSGRKVLIYLAVLIVVVGGYYVSEWQRSRQQAQEKTAQQVFQIKAGDISTLTLKSDKGEIKVERVPAGDQAPASDQPSAPAATPAAEEWRLTKPIAGRTDDLTIKSILSALADLNRQRLLDEAPGDKLKEFGLDKPIFILDFQAAGQNHQLRFGSKAPGGQSIYAQKDAEPRVLLIRLTDKETLDRTLTALRRKAIFSLSPEKVTEIRLTRNGERLVLQKTADLGWTPKDHPQTRLRTDKIEALLRQLGDARALEFVAEKADDLKKYGLAPSPPLRLTVLSGTREETLLLGGKQGDRYYAQRSGADPIMLVDTAWVDKLPVSSESLEDRRLWSGPDNEVQKVVWGGPDKKLTAVRKGSGWEIQQPDLLASPEAAFKFSLVFWRLKDLEFTRLLPAPGANQDKAPGFTLELFGPEDKRLFRLAEFPAEKDQALVAFSQGEKTATAVIPAKTMAELKQILAGLTAAGPKGQENPSPAK
jgi:hypothetical protein